MNKNTIRKINGGIAIYYGIGAVVGAIAGVIGIGIWLFKVFAHQTNFSWGILATLAIISVVLGVVGYSILRVGYEEIEE